MRVNPGQIVARHIGKSYRLYERKIDRLREWFSGAVLHREHWALKNIQLTVQAGEAIGVVGPNGAGKSTLLKLIAGVIQPSTGEIFIGGRVCALLELGLGFDPELNGYENLAVAGQLLGLEAHEIAEKTPWIEDFSELGAALQEPLRTYSSGMQMRLAFALAVAKRPDILIVDEALSVGDLFFQQKCYALIQDYHAQGSTLFFVTHSMGAIQHLCDRALLLDQGQLLLDGEPQAVMNLYESRGLAARTAADDGHLSIDTQTLLPHQQGSLHSQRIALRAIDWWCGDERIQSVRAESDVLLGVRLQAQVTLADVHVGIKLRDKYGLVIYETNTYCQGHAGVDLQAQELLHLGFRLPLNVREGQYNVTLGVATGGYGDGQFREQLWYAHGLAPIEVLRRQDIGLWDGVTNLGVRIERISSNEKGAS